jgi:hypothetical protein
VHVLQIVHDCDIQLIDIAVIHMSALALNTQVQFFRSVHHAYSLYLICKLYLESKDYKM